MVYCLSESDPGQRMLTSKASPAALLAAWDSADYPSAPLTPGQRAAINAISSYETDTETAEDPTGIYIYTYIYLYRYRC